MHRPVDFFYSLAGLLIALGVLTGLFISQSATAQIPNVPFIAYDQTISSEVTSLNGTEHFFTGCRGESVSISVTAADFVPRIDLYGSDEGGILATATAGSNSAGSRTVVLTNIALPTPGLYTIVVSGRSRSDRGSYSLTIEGRGPNGARLEDAATALNIALGEIVTGTVLAPRVDQWTFRGCDGDEIRAVMSGEGFDPELSLYAPHAERPIATAIADGTDETSGDSRAELSRTLPESGSFLLAAAGRTDAGDYELALSLERSATATVLPTPIAQVTATDIATPTAASGPRVRRGIPTPQATPISTPAYETPGIGESAFRIIDVGSASGPVNHIAYAPDGNSFASAGEDGAVRVWVALNGELLQTLTGHENRVNYVAYAPAGDLLASAADDGTARLWDAMGTQVAQLDMPTNRVNSVTFSPAGTELVATSDGGDVLLWDVAQRSVRLELTGHEAPVYHAVFSPDGASIATGDAAGVVRIWNTADGMLTHTLPVNRGPGSGDPILSIAFSNDGQRIVVGGVIGVNDASVQIWEIESEEQIGALAGHNEWGSRALFSPGNDYILSAGRADPAQEGSAAATARLWNASTGELAIAFLGYRSSVVAALFRPDGEELLSSDGTSVYIWPAPMIDVLAAFADPVAVQMPVPTATTTATVEAVETQATPNPTPTRAATATPTATLTPTLTPTPIGVPPSASLDIFCTVTTDRLNLRAGPGTSFNPPVGVLELGEIVQVTGRNEDFTWLQVAVLDETLAPVLTGWVTADFVFCVGPIEDAPVVQ
jgi:hypothetical protein